MARNAIVELALLVELVQKQATKKRRGENSPRERKLEKKASSHCILALLALLTEKEAAAPRLLPPTQPFNFELNGCTQLFFR